MDTDQSSAPSTVRTDTLDRLADRIEAEIDRLRRKRPHLEERIDRAANIIVAQLSCRRGRPIRVRISPSGSARFLVNGSGGAVYTVNPESWTCSCPDHHRRDAVCKHALACYVLNRAAQPAPLTTRVKVRECDGCQQTFARRDLVEVQHEHQNEHHFPGDVLCRGCADRSGVEW